MVRKIETPEESYEDSNLFYTREEVERYDNNTGMRNIQTLLLKVGLNVSKVDISNKHLKVLDIGCGSGYGIFFLNSLGIKNVFGIDPSLEMIKVCKKKGYNVFLYGFEDLNKLTEKYDLIVSISALQWIITNKKEIEIKNVIKKIGKELYRLLKEKGKVILQFYVKEENIFEIISSSFSRLGFDVGMYVYNEHSLKKRKFFLILNKK